MPPSHASSSFTTSSAVSRALFGATYGIDAVGAYYTSVEPINRGACVRRAGMSFATMHKDLCNDVYTTRIIVLL